MTRDELLQAVVAGLIKGWVGPVEVNIDVLAAEIIRTVRDWDATA